MADTKLHSMTENTTPASTDELYLLDDATGVGVDNRMTLATLTSYIQSLNIGGAVMEAGYFGYLSPADSTTYYFGPQTVGTPATTANTHPFTIRKTGTIYAIDLILVVDGTLGSAETFTTSFRLNNTTDTTISAVCQMDQAYEVFSNTGLSIAVTSGDTFEIKMVTPAWVTNPTNTRAMAVIWMR